MFCRLKKESLYLRSRGAKKKKRQELEREPKGFLPSAAVGSSTPNEANFSNSQNICRVFFPSLYDIFYPNVLLVIIFNIYNLSVLFVIS